MNRKLKYGLIYGLGTLGLISASAGIVVGIILPKTLKLKKGLENFVVASPGEDIYKSFANKKLYYVALGDSFTAGSNGALGRDSYSYADFLANDLRNSNKLAGYKNFAQSGDGIFDVMSKILGNTSKMHALRKANIISITIGSNDLLSVFKLLEIGYTANIKDLVFNMFSSGNDKNKEREKVNINKNLNDVNEIQGKKYLVGNTSSSLNQGEKFYLLRKSIHKFVKMYKNKDFYDIISIQSAWKNKIFDVIKRNITILIHDIHALNPNAKILFVGPYFPFPHFLEKHINKTIVEIGISVKQIFEKFILSMRESSEFSLEGTKNKFVDFIDIRKLKVTKTTSKGEIDSRDGKNLYFKDYIKKQESFTSVKKIELGKIPSYWKRNAFSNSLDIHPSIFGHQIIGNAIFSRIYNHFKIKDKKSEDFYTFTKPYDTETSKQVDWARVDEDSEAFNIHLQYLLTNLALGKGNFAYAIWKIANKHISSKNFFRSIISKYLSELNKLEYDDYTPILELLDEDKMIDVIIAIFENKDKIMNLINKITNATKNNKIKVALDEVEKISSLLKVLTIKEEKKLFEKTNKKVDEFKEKAKSEKLEKLFRSVFGFIVKPNAISMKILQKFL